MEDVKWGDEITSYQCRKNAVDTCKICVSFLPVAQWIFLPLRQRRQLWRCDEDCVLTALGFINLYQPGLLWPVTVHLQNRARRRLGGGTMTPSSITADGNE